MSRRPKGARLDETPAVLVLLEDGLNRSGKFRMSSHAFAQRGLIAQQTRVGPHGALKLRYEFFDEDFFALIDLVDLIVAAGSQA